MSAELSLDDHRPCREAERRAEQAVAELVRKNEELRALLQEWLNVGFFDDRRGWGVWVSEFRPRVEAALKEAEP